MFEINLGLSYPSSSSPSSPLAASAASRLLAKSLAFPEVWSITANPGTGLFDLRRGLSRRSQVPAIDPDLSSWAYPGLAVLVAYDRLDRRFPKIVQVVGRLLYTDPSTGRNYTLGDWMQTFSQPSLLHTGSALAVWPVAESLALFSIAENVQETNGMSRQFLGMVAFGSIYIAAFGVADIANTGIEKIRLRAWSQADDSLQWSYDLDLGGNLVFTGFPGTSNLFVDVDKLSLGVILHDLWHVPIPTDAGGPTSSVSSPDGTLTGKAVGMAWDLLSLCTGTSMYLSRRLDTGLWQGVNSLSLLDHVDGQSDTWSDGLFGSQRPPTYSPDSENFVAITTAKSTYNRNNFKPDHYAGSYEDWISLFPGWPQIQPIVSEVFARMHRSGGVYVGQYNVRNTYTVRDASTLATEQAAFFAAYPVFTGTTIETHPTDGPVQTDTYLDDYGLTPDGSYYVEIGSADRGYYNADWLPDSGSTKNHTCPQYQGGANTGLECVLMSIRLSDEREVYAVQELAEVIRYGVSAAGARLFDMTTGNPSEEPVWEGPFTDGSHTGPYYNRFTPIHAVPLHTFTTRTMLKWTDGVSVLSEMKLSNTHTGLTMPGGVGATTTALDYACDVMQMISVTPTAPVGMRDKIITLQSYRGADGDAIDARTLIALSGEETPHTVVVDDPDYTAVNTLRFARMVGHFAGEGLTGEVNFVIVRVKHFHVALAFSDPSYVRHDMVVYDMTDLASPIEALRLTEYTNLINQATTMPNDTGLDRLIIIGDKIRYASANDAFGWQMWTLV